MRWYTPEIPVPEMLGQGNVSFKVQLAGLGNGWTQSRALPSFHRDNSVNPEIFFRR